MFAVRGYLLDVSRGRVPLVRTWRLIVDLLARCRYTHLFVFLGPSLDPPVAAEDDWGESAGLSDDDRRKLGAYCRLQGLELEFLAGDPSRAFVSSSGTTFAAAFPYPDGSVALLGGGTGPHPFDADCSLLHAEARPFYVCPPTERACSLAGRVEAMREIMQEAEHAAFQYGAAGFVVTDWAGPADWEPLAVSLPGILMGGAFAASGAKAAKMDLERELGSVLDAPLAGLLLKLGTLYLRGGAARLGASEYYNILAGDCGYSRHPGLTQTVLDDVSGIARGVRVAAERWTDRSDWAKEIVYMANLLDCACHRRDERRLRELRDEHGRIWRMRFQEAGRVESLARLPRF